MDIGVSVRPSLLDSGFHRSDEWRGPFPSFRRTPESSDLKDGIECPYNNGLTSKFLPTSVFQRKQIFLSISPHHSITLSPHLCLEFHLGSF
jgi:hypothetical protein